MRPLLLLGAAASLAVAFVHPLHAQAPVSPVPEGAAYVASSQGRVYYWVGCEAWHALSPGNLRFFDSAGEAVAAGYAPSASQGCSGPPVGVPAPGSRIPCEVTRVIDGDTIECAGLGSVRLLLIDAPEMDQGPFGPAARSVLAGLLPLGARLELEIDLDPNDQYGRTLAYAHLPDGRIANEELLRAGVAVVSVYPPNVKYVDRFRAVLEGARAGRRGLWAENGFSCLPADHRAGRC